MKFQKTEIMGVKLIWLKRADLQSSAISLFDLSLPRSHTTFHLFTIRNRSENFHATGCNYWSLANAAATRSKSRSTGDCTFPKGNFAVIVPGSSHRQCSACASANDKLPSRPRRLATQFCQERGEIVMAKKPSSRLSSLSSMKVKALLGAGCKMPASFLLGG